jgi:hypothetical protein
MKGIERDQVKEEQGISKSDLFVQAQTNDYK